MVYKKYGITFQNMRKQNRFTLSEFGEVGIPTSTLSDFDSHLNFYSPTDPIYLLKEVEHAVLSKDDKKLHSLQKTCTETKQKYICFIFV